ncbi:HK97 gp10 family phage protein [Paraburkholderia sp. WSM4175]|uniref:HK97-gp10 family putative phage morphogenesis protein n=1 Tax=Paraburkholderia sp. WSM4175 TaxID=2991072 RepID=UPI003D215967
MNVFVNEVQGLKELGDFLKKLPGEMESKMLRASLMAASKPIMDKARENARAISERNTSGYAVGILQEGIVRSRVRPDRTVHAVRVDVKLRKVRGRPTMFFSRSGERVYKKQGSDPFYGRFLEFGTSRSPAQPWLKPAAEARHSEADHAMRKRLTQQVKRHAKANGVRFEPGTT